MDPACERSDTIATLESALVSLERSMSVRLIPPEGASFGYAMRGARDSSGVVAVRIRDVDGRPHPDRPSAFNTEEAVVRNILTVTKLNPMVRSAAVLRFSDRALAVIEDDLFLDCASYTPAPGQLGISTMDWGIASACKKGIPDVIYEKNPDKTRIRLLLFGEDPADVANNIIICSGRLLHSEL
jgi:predicted fused transcriptional regulator/phosphomethylpyrimidine kinase